MPANCFYGVDADMELNAHLEFLQNQIVRLHGVTVDLEDILWHFFRMANRDMSICTEIIVETANDSQMLEEFSRALIADPARPRSPDPPGGQ